MIVLLFVVHVAIAVSLVGVILLQKSEGGALGMGGGGMSGFMTGRSTANLLTRTTGFLAIGFFATSVLLVVLSNRTGGAPRSLIDQGPAPSTQEAPAVPAPAAPAPTAPTPEPAKPAEPSAPMAK
jgi:preprotein translocase subunit SecG